MSRAQAGVAFVAELVPIEDTGGRRGPRIDRSQPPVAFAALSDAGETADLSLGLADIFGGEIDFNTERSPTTGSSCSSSSRDGEAFAGYGPILAARFDNAGRRLRAVRFTSDAGETGYFDERGVSMRRFFLQSPLKFEPTITSGFSRSRLHPILGERRAHLGVDYRAPAGAPVIAVADGVVVAAGIAGDAGRIVHLRHANGFDTEYLHLSSIAVRVGARVKQGGSSAGWARAVWRWTHTRLPRSKERRVRESADGSTRHAAGRQWRLAEQPAFAEARDRAFAQLAPVVLLQDRAKLPAASCAIGSPWPTASTSALPRSRN